MIGRGFYTKMIWAWEEGWKGRFWGYSLSDYICSPVLCLSLSINLSSLLLDHYRWLMSPVFVFCEWSWMVFLALYYKQMFLKTK
jgi:hypothetical protein